MLTKSLEHQFLNSQRDLFRLDLRTRQIAFVRRQHRRRAGAPGCPHSVVVRQRRGHHAGARVGLRGAEEAASLLHEFPTESTSVEQRRRKLRRSWRYALGHNLRDHLRQRPIAATSGSAIACEVEKHSLYKRRRLRRACFSQPLQCFGSGGAQLKEAQQQLLNQVDVLDVGPPRATNRSAGQSQDVVPFFCRGVGTSERDVTDTRQDCVGTRRHRGSEGSSRSRPGAMSARRLHACPAAEIAR